MPRPKLTPAECRERVRLRSERWRRAHGIGPKKPAQRQPSLLNPAHGLPFLPPDKPHYFVQPESFRVVAGFEVGIFFHGAV